ncbi:hypothetical protein SOASR032_24150 [Pragia fontium]|uniref:Lysozyme n=1 Tax=Pragia fontium TaxID=82985 RepID=A0ABQ5LJQ5_9GAMM|nr:lysozyme [Pragia fontium]GKX63846.1 hypothetical protein SOASR032_24150 [Pragia fontium]
MQISSAGINHIKSFEGCELKAYPDPGTGGIPWTIGYGHTKGVKRGDVIDKAEAERLLKCDLAQFEQDVTRLVKVPLTQNQFDALVSFAFNAGVMALSTSTLLKKLNASDYAGAAGQFDRWVYAGKKRLAGLERRRRVERRMFES